MSARFGRYTVVKPLARGGMAEVFLGRLDGPGGFVRPVVIKRILPRHAGNHAFVEMFLDEARIAASIRHPNVVHVEDLGLESGEPYIVMEYLAGETVAALLERARGLDRQLDPRLVIHLVSEVLAGLHAAHTLSGLDGQPKGIVHRDVSPQNVMVSYDGHVKVLDFGIASADHRLAKTSTGEIKGKVAYISPEQCSGGSIDAKSDIFSVGVMMFELATLRHPFKKDNEAATLMALVSEDYLPLEGTRGDLPVAFRGILAKSMIATKHKRYASANDMRRDLLKLGRELGSDEPLETLLASELRTLFVDRMADKAQIANEIAAWREPMETVPEVAQSRESAPPSASRAKRPDERQVGRYTLHARLGAGGMAEVHYGTLRAPEGISRPVAIKKLHAALVEEAEAKAILLDEARLVARVQHPNVVQLIDVVADGSDLFLVLEYVHGETLASLLRGRRARIDPSIAVGIASGILEGLHAAHSAADENGLPLGIVHRDVSPQNIMVGIDGTARVLDFGIAKAEGRAQQATRTGFIKGKLAYMAPEQLRTGIASPRSDVFSAALVLWELCTGKRMFDGDSEVAVRAQVLTKEIPLMSTLIDVPPPLAAAFAKALARDPADRYESARSFAADLERALSPASPRAVAEWLASFASIELAKRAAMVRRFTRGTSEAAEVPEAAPAREIESAQQRVALSVDAEAAAAPAPVEKSKKRIFIAIALSLLLGTVVLLAGFARQTKTDTQANTGAAPIPDPLTTTLASNASLPSPASATPRSFAPSAAPSASASTPGPHVANHPSKPQTAPGRPASPTCHLVRQTDARGIITFERACN